MAKHKRKDKSKSDPKRIDPRTGQRKAGERKRSAPAPEGTARRTLNAALYFFKRAGHLEHQPEYYGYYVEAAMVFTRMALEHLKSEYRGNPAAVTSINNFEEKPSIKAFRDNRNLISHQRSISISPTQKDDFYPDEPLPEGKAAYEMLRDQLEEIGAIIEECEKMYK